MNLAAITSTWVIFISHSSSFILKHRCLASQLIERHFLQRSNQLLANCPERVPNKRSNSNSHGPCLAFAYKPKTFSFRPGLQRTNYCRGLLFGVCCSLGMWPQRAFNTPFESKVSKLKNLFWSFVSTAMGQISLENSLLIKPKSWMNLTTIKKERMINDERQAGMTNASHDSREKALIFVVQHSDSRVTMP